MRIKALIIVVAAAAIIGGTYLLIDDRPLTSDELASVTQACLACHGRVPTYDDFHLVHNVHISFRCERCHETEETTTIVEQPRPTATVRPANETPVTTPTPTAGATATPTPAAIGTATETTNATAVPVTASSGPPTIPHTLVDRGNCLGCHVTNSDHAGRTNDMCRLCHIQ